MPDPDALLLAALAAPPAEAKAAAHVLADWIRRGGYAPRESVARGAGVTARRKLPHSKGKLYIEVFEGGLALVWSGPPALYYRLRRD
jgi:hypothetical protein